jgi:hypothetical protein
MISKLFLIAVGAGVAFAQSALVNNVGNFIHDVAALKPSVHFFHDVLGLGITASVYPTAIWICHGPRAIGRAPRACLKCTTLKGAGFASPIRRYQARRCGSNWWSSEA